MVRVPDVNVPAGNTRALDLCVTAQAQIGVARGEHFFIDRAVRIMTGGAAFAQRLMFEDERSGLLAMALRATFVLPGHGQSAGWFEDVAAMRVVAGPTTHAAFNDRVMLGQIEFRLNVEMALKAGGRVVAGIDDEFGAAAGGDVLAAGAVTGFTAGFAGQGRPFKMDPRVRAGGEFPDDFRVAIHAGMVADVMCAGDCQRRHDHSRCGGA